MPVSNKKLRSNRAWIERHINDPYVKRSKAEGYRARSVYKLLELIEQSSWEYYAIFNRRILDEASYGANWLMRRRAPSGSFFKAGPLRLPDAYELSEVTRKCGFEYKNTIGEGRKPVPQEQWKITDEDWRNRDKWDQYEDAVNEMLQKTSTEYAPWHILESVDKKYARIKALRIVVEELEKVLGCS